MTNIWGFLSQTIYVSSMAVLILLIKLLMKDKLPARWQYGIWIMLIFCVFTPVGSAGGYIIPQLHILLETLKYAMEKGLNSAFTSADVPVFNIGPLPVITLTPVSITDILFVVYAVGVAIYLAKYLYEYIKLSRIIHSFPDADPNVQLTVEDVALKYNLTSCKAKEIKGLTSAFVFGVFHPVLVLPKGYKTDDKIILHELLHLKHKDLWQNMFWAVVKALHWPNPFLHYVFKTINNDMESLCDYRVMEMLVGEERRDYGRILLSMTNDRYPSAFGTTSISNGGRFISERIQSIARFRLYPQGMGMVALCIIILLAPLTVMGNEMQYFPQGSYSRNPDTFTYRYQHARARLSRCRTVAGAIDTYVKAMLTGNELYYLAIDPISVAVQNHWLPEKIDVAGNKQLYYVVDLEKVNSKTYVANLLLKDFKTNLEDRDGRYKSGSNNITIPIKIIKEHGWKVYQTGDAASNLSIVLAGDADYTTIDVDGYPVGDRYEYKATNGIVDIVIHKVNTVKNSKIQSGFMFSQTVHNMMPIPNARFSDGYYAVDIEYKPDSWDDISQIGMVASTLSKMSENGKGSSGTGYNRTNVSRNVSNNINTYRMKTEMERMTAADNTRFTDLQKAAIKEIMSKAEVNFGELIILDDSFKTIRKTKGIHVRVTVDGVQVCNRKINLKEGKLYDQNIK